MPNKAIKRLIIGDKGEGDALIGRRQIKILS